MKFSFVKQNFRPQKWAKLILPMVKAKTILFSFSLDFAFKQTKETFFFQVQPLKIFNSNFFVVADFRVAGKTF